MHYNFFLPITPPQTRQQIYLIGCNSLEKNIVANPILSRRPPRSNVRLHSIPPPPSSLVISAASSLVLLYPNLAPKNVSAASAVSLRPKDEK